MNTNHLAALPAIALLLGLAACGARNSLLDFDARGATGGQPSAASTASALDSASSAIAGSGAGGEAEGAGGAAPIFAPHDTIQLALGSEHACALFGDHTVKCWGKNDHGQLGLGDAIDRGSSPDTMGAALPTVDLGQGRTAIAIAAGFDVTCAVLDTHELKCWGWSPFGELGLGDTATRGDAPGSMGDALPVVDLGPSARVDAVHVGNYHVCALLHDGSIRCWGDANASGSATSHGAAPGTMGAALPAVQIGTKKAVKHVFAGFNTSCAILDDEATKCWGSNEQGELGLGDTKGRGSEPGTMGDALPAIDFGAPRRAVQVAPSSYSTCALLDDGSVRCWGNGADLGLGNTKSYGGTPGTMGVNLPAVDLGAGRTALTLTTGARWACALLDDHQIKCWGYNPAGQLGQGDIDSRGDAPFEMGDALPPIDLGAGTSALAVEAGSFFGCAILATREVKCWGANSHGELGLGDTASRGGAPGEMGDALPVVALW
jgi:alpha-tubulin suppressor-like RCC1 family protein